MYMYVKTLLTLITSGQVKSKYRYGKLSPAYVWSSYSQVSFFLNLFN